MTVKSFDNLHQKLVLTFEDEGDKPWWEIFNFFLEFFSTMTIIRVKENPELYTVQVHSDKDSVILQNLGIKVK